MPELDQANLELGESFDRDLVSSDGALLLPAGQIVSEKLLNELVAAGCKEVFLSGHQAFISPYSADCVETIDQLFSDAPELVNEIARRLQAGEHVGPDELDETIDRSLATIDSDPSAVLARAIRCISDGDGGLKNLRMSNIAMVAARELQFSDADCKAVGRAGLLCDIALPVNGPQLEDIPPETTEYDRGLLRYYEHPRRAAELLKDGLPGVSQLELILVAQVHEQCDGSGFPNSLRQHHLHKLSRLLNTIEAFLTLTDTSNAGGKFVPSDALAYLVLHSLYGTFDRDCVRALVAAAAIYPIGTHVSLDDSSTGIVIRSTGADYMEPIIQLSEKAEMIDLRGRNRMIVSPLADGEAFRRLPKSLLNETLWMRAA